GDDEVEADIDVALAFGLGVIGLHGLAQAFTLLLHAERHHQRVAAEGGGPGTALEVVGHDDAGPARLGEVHVAVDPAREHQLAARIDDFVCRTQVIAQRRDAPAANTDVADDGVAGVGHPSATDDGVEYAHGRAI